MKFKLSLPNDYASEKDSEAAFLQAFGEGAENRRLDPEAENIAYEPIADAANAAGLTYAAESTYGAIWEGTLEQFAACVAELPAWAQRYASILEE